VANSTNYLAKTEAVLLVDDDDLYVRTTTRLIRALGYSLVFRASSAIDALPMLSRVRPALVLTDMVMEHRAAGREVVRACHALGIAVAVVSGLPGLEDEDLGCHFCSKSWLRGTTLEQLLTTMISDRTIHSQLKSAVVSRRLAG
jgi:CheY-like chemotaxis protein